MDDIVIRIPAVWARRVQSPLMWLVSALTGVSITFVPLSLFQLGRSGETFANPLVWVCFVVIYAVPLFYIRLAGVILKQLHDAELPPVSRS